MYNKDTGLSCCIKAEHENSHLLVAEYLGEQLAHGGDWSAGGATVADDYWPAGGATVADYSLTHNATYHHLQ